MEEKEIEEWIVSMYKEIAWLRKHYPKDFLTIEYLYIQPINKPIPVGLFMCRECRRPITHKQYAFSGLCGSCDLGKENPKWEIKKPVIERVIDEL